MKTAILYDAIIERQRPSKLRFTRRSSHRACRFSGKPNDAKHRPSQLAADRYARYTLHHARRHTLKRRKASRLRKIIIIAGPNGAGKTTFAQEFLPHEADCDQFINADLIARGLSPFAPERAALQAGRIMLSQISANVAAGKSFAFEATLAGLNYTRHIPRWRTAGYQVNWFF